MKGTALLAIVVVAVLAIGFVSGKGSRGGSSRSSSSYRSSSYRSSSYRSSSYRASRVRTWSTSQKTKAALVGSIFISYRLRTRYGAGKDWDNDDYNVCRNMKKYPNFNGSTTEYGWFLCPTDDVPNENSYCCGSEDDGNQSCCGYWSSGAGIGAIVAIVIFTLIGIVALCVFVWCVMKKSTKKRTAPTEFSGAAVVYSNESATVTTKNDGFPPEYSSTFAQSPPYPTQDAAYPPMAAAYPPMPVPNSPPPAYPGADNAAPETKVPPAAFSETS